ncbi:hypothetical protein ACFLRP_01300 [Bacteroidota bacterium]
MYLTLNISAKEIRLVAANRKGVKHWSSKALMPGWIKNGYILEPGLVGATIESLFKSAKIARTDVTVCITGLPFTYRIAKLPHMKRGLLKDSIRHLMSKETSMSTEQMSLSWAAINENDDEVTYFVLGVDQQVVNVVAETMQKARIKHWTMDLKSLALARAASLDKAIVISAELDCYDIVLISDGIVSTIHTVSAEASNDNAEHARQITVETSKAMAYDAKLNGQGRFGQDTPVLITGEISSDNNLRELIQTELGYQVKPLTPLLANQSDLPVHLYAVNIGLALKYIGDLMFMPEDAPYYDIDLDILSGRYTKSQVRLTAVSLVSAVILAAAIGVAAPALMANAEYNAEIITIRNELNMVNQQLQEAQLADESTMLMESNASAILAQVDKMKKGRQALLGNQGALAINLDKVIDALPENGYFTSLSLAPERITVRGQAGNAFQVVDYTKAVEQKGLPPNIRIAEIGEPSAEESDYNSVSFEVVITK